MSKATMQVEGEVIEAGARVPAGKKFKVELVLECSSKPEYPNPVKVECYGDEISTEAARLQIGDVVKIDGYLRGREYNGKYYVNASAAKIEMVTKAAAPRSEADRDADEARKDNDNLPF